MAVQESLFALHDAVCLCTLQLYCVLPQWDRRHAVAMHFVLELDSLMCRESLLCMNLRTLRQCPDFTGWLRASGFFIGHRGLRT